MVSLPAPAQHIAIVDDDPVIVKMLSITLETADYRISSCDTGQAFRALMQDRSLSLLILDPDLPDEDGLDICRDLRGVSDIPIILLTDRSEEVDRVLGLEMGADDYLVKPILPRELLARVRALLRRSNGRTDRAIAKETPAPLKSERYRFAGWTLDGGNRVLTSPQDQHKTLTDGEFRLLKSFLLHPFEELSRDRLVEFSRRRNMDAFERSVDNMISRLRRHLKTDGQLSPLIQTIRGVGYMFNAQVTRESGTADFVGARRKPRVLLVEDDEVVQFSLEVFLRDLGCQVDVCVDGASALSRFQKQFHDLIFMDCHLPVMDGYQASSRIRDHEKNIATDFPVPIIAISFQKRSDNLTRCAAAGINDFLEKPIIKSDLKRVLQRWIPTGSRSARMPLAAEAFPLDPVLIDCLKKDNVERFSEFIQLVLKLFPKRLVDLKRHFDRQDYGESIQVLEQMLSSARSVGAQRLVHLCQDLRLQVQNNNWHTDHSLKLIENEWDRIYDALQAALKGS